MSKKRNWKQIKKYEDILFEFWQGIAKITNRPRYRNAFRPTTTLEMSDALRHCKEDPKINVVVFTGAGDKAFCSGGDQNLKGKGGYIGERRHSPVECAGRPETNTTRCPNRLSPWSTVTLSAADMYFMWFAI